MCLSSAGSLLVKHELICNCTNTEQLTTSTIARHMARLATKCLKIENYQFFESVFAQRFSKVLQPKGFA